MDVVFKQHVSNVTDDTENDDVHDATVAKAVAICVLFLSAFSLGVIPIKLAKWFNWKSDTKSNIYVQVLLCMGGGVLLCTTFMHLLPEVEEGIENSDVLKNIDVPLAKLLMCLGFFAMYFIEECVHVYLHMREEKNNMEVFRRSLSIRRGELTAQSTKEDALKDLEEGHKNHKHGHDHKVHKHDDQKGHSHFVIEEDTFVTNLKGLLIVLALSIHELFEGLAIGLESQAGNVWYMFGAVSAHKLIIAFCIGVELITCKIRTLLIVIYIFTFAIVSPMGIGIGIGLTEEGSSSTDVPSVILQGLATGTLLYVVFFEILQSDRKSGLKQYFGVLSGFLIMFAINMIKD